MLWRKRSTLAFASLWLLFGRTMLSCPSLCQFCSEYSAECENVSSLPEVLGGLSHSIESIKLRHGNLSKIPPQSFTKFYNLRFLSITGFLVSALSNLTFATTQINSLRRLDLSHNHLLSCTIEPMAFSGLIFLDELILTNNSLDILRQSWFLQTPQLSKLFLSFNRILYLAPRTFENLARLKELDVSSNMIQYLPMDAFYGLSNLIKLDLSNNKILFINHQVFRPLHSLRYLFLFRNKLTILPLLPSSITVLYLHENPWNCSCKLATSMESLTDKIQAPAGVVCNNPPSLAGHQAMNAKPEGCRTAAPPSPSSLMPFSPLPSSSDSLSSSFASSSSSSSSSSVALLSHHSFEIVHLWLLCGILGGLFVGVTLCLICCFCLPKRCPCMLRKLNCWDPCALRSRSAEWMRPPSQNPGLALWEVEKAMGEIRARQRDGNERETDVRNQWCCQRHCVHCEHCKCVRTCGGREHSLALKGPEPHGSPLQQATSQQTDGSVMDKQVETCVGGQTTAWVPSPSTLVHVDCRDGKSIRVESERATVRAASSGPQEPWRGAVHIGGPRSRSGSLSSFSRPLRCGTESEARLWSKASLKRRHPRQSVESAGAPPYARPCSTERLSAVQEGHKKRKGTPSSHPSHSPVRGVTYSSLLFSPSNQASSVGPTRSSYVEMHSVGLRPLKKESFSPSLDHIPLSTQTSLERPIVGSHQQGVGISSAGNLSTIGRVWSCQRCGYKVDHPCAGAVRSRTQSEMARRNSGRRQSDAVTKLSSSSTVRNLAQSTLALQASDKRGSGELRPSRHSSTFKPLVPVTSGRRQSDRGTGSGYSFGPDAATAALEKELSQKVSDAVFLPTRKATLSDQGRTLDARKSSAERSTDSSSQESVVIGVVDALDNPDGIPRQNSVPGVAERTSVFSGRERVYSSVSPTYSPHDNRLVSESFCKSRSKAERWDAKPNELEERGSIASNGLLLQKMCQLEFPFLVVEEEPSSLSDEDEGGARD